MVAAAARNPVVEATVCTTPPRRNWMPWWEPARVSCEN